MTGNFCIDETEDAVFVVFLYINRVNYANTG